MFSLLPVQRASVSILVHKILVSASMATDPKFCFVVARFSQLAFFQSINTGNRQYSLHYYIMSCYFDVLEWKVPKYVATG